VAHLRTCEKMEKSSTQYLRMYWTNPHQIFRVGKHMGVDDNSYILTKGRCYGTQLILGAKIEHGLILPSFFALAFQNDLGVSSCKCSH